MIAYTIRIPTSMVTIYIYIYKVSLLKCDLVFVGSEKLFITTKSRQWVLIVYVKFHLWSFEPLNIFKKVDDRICQDTY